MGLLDDILMSCIFKRMDPEATGIAEVPLVAFTRRLVTKHEYDALLFRDLVWLIQGGFCEEITNFARESLRRMSMY